MFFMLLSFSSPHLQNMSNHPSHCVVKTIYTAALPWSKFWSQPEFCRNIRNTRFMSKNYQNSLTTWRGKIYNHLPLPAVWPDVSVPTAPSDRVPPIIRQGPTNHTLAPGSTAQLHCYIMGNPIPSIQWEKDGQRILGNDGRISLMENGTFQIINLQVFKLNISM